VQSGAEVVAEREHEWQPRGDATVRAPKDGARIQEREARGIQRSSERVIAKPLAGGALRAHVGTVARAIGPHAAPLELADQPATGPQAELFEEKSDRPCTLAAVDRHFRWDHIATVEDPATNEGDGQPGRA
jgi:hypothetical protein